MDKQRNILTGVSNIIRFNSGFYIAGFGIILLLFSLAGILNGQLKTWAQIFAWAGIIPLVLSLVVSWFVYDVSGFYKLEWMQTETGKKSGYMLNIHAGFDETSALLKAKFPEAQMFVYDFYDPKKHTEPSIERARKAYMPFPGTLQINTESIPQPGNSVEIIFLIFAAHEIRDNEERIQFFSELKRILKPGGTMHVVEHIRDLPNFFAYTIGFFHFLSRAAWLETFAKSGFFVKKQSPINPFVKYFILQK